METIYLLVKSVVGREVEITEEFKRLHKVKEISAITGPYDYLIKLEGENMHEIGETIIRQARQIHGINDTLTMVVLASYPPPS